MVSFGQEEHQEIDSMYGSFVGAMGCVQQVPSIQRKFTMDYNGEGIKDPWDLEDCRRFHKLKTSRTKRYRLKTLAIHLIAEDLKN
jgi:hypothetical protein